MTSVAAPLVDIYCGALRTRVFESNELLGEAAAASAKVDIATAIAERGSANIILATGNSQISFLEALRQQEVEWDKVRVFHMDQYLGMPADHPGSFVRFLKKHFLDVVEVSEFYPISGKIETAEETCRAYAEQLLEYPPDLVALGIGENGHLAFNDPPHAQFDDPALVRVVDLESASRRQQVGEGHFATIDDVPKQAITLTIPALLSSRNIYGLVPESRKADIVRRCLTRPISEDLPATILRLFRSAQLYLDRDSGSRMFAFSALHQH